jgi:hypothetical protein
MWLTLANDLEKSDRFLEQVGLYPTLAMVSLGVFVLSYLVRAVENYVRHLHGKPYLHYGQPRFVLTTVGCILVVDGFVIGWVFQERLQLHVPWVTVSAGLLCLITSGALSVWAHLRRPIQPRRAAAPPAARGDEATGEDGDPPGSAGAKK